MIAYRTQFIRPNIYADSFPFPVHTTQATPVTEEMIPMGESPQYRDNPVITAQAKASQSTSIRVQPLISRLIHAFI